MIDLVIFDLDGVLVKAKEMHFSALNEALESIDPKFSISFSEHLNIYDGLKTRDKLELLTKDKGLPPSSHNIIWDRKQRITATKVSRIEKDQNLFSLLDFLVGQNIKIACCSNSIRKSVYSISTRNNKFFRFNHF